MKCCKIEIRDLMGLFGPKFGDITNSWSNSLRFVLLSRVDRNLQIVILGTKLKRLHVQTPNGC